MVTHADAARRVAAMFHLYWSIDRDRLGELHPVDWVEDMYPNLFDWFTTAWGSHDDQREDWRDIVHELIKDEL
jgi:hypothetical protein